MISAVSKLPQLKKIGGIYRKFNKSCQFSSNVALVTGGGRGIGRAISLELAKHGCKIVVNYVNDSVSAEKVVNEINSTHGEERAIKIQCDCSNQDAVKSMISSIVKEFGQVDILVNNAGITKDGLAVNMKAVDFSSVVTTDLNGVFYCSQSVFGQSMMRKRVGRIINIASVVGQIGNAGQANYAAAKGGVIAMTRALAKEFSARGVTVNSVCPGFIESDMTAALNETQRATTLASIPLKRFGTPQEVAGMVRFLALDPAASYITGHCFNVDGGLAIGAT